MSSILFLTGIGFFAVFGFAFSDTLKTGKALNSLTAVKSRFPSKTMEKLLLIAQLPELAHIVEHATAINIVATLILFGLWLALRSGAEDELF